jgi:hypothetical protein
MLVNTDPNLLLLVFIAAILGGPTLYVFLRIIAHIILWLFPAPIVDEVQLNELRPDTYIGCPDGLCYLPLFKKQHHPRVIRQIGHFPSIRALVIVSKSYRANPRGVLKVIGDGVGHFEPNRREGLVWDLVEEMMTQFDLIGGRHLTRVSILPPDGYSYVELFMDIKHNEILTVLGPNPLLQTVIDINPAYRFGVKGWVFEREAGHLCFETGHLIDRWMQVLAWNACHPGVRFG